MSAESERTVAKRDGWSSEAPVPNKFLICAVAFLRAQQLSLGAKPRIQDVGHKPAHLAVLEVLADTVSWSNDPIGSEESPADV